MGQDVDVEQQASSAESTGSKSAIELIAEEAKGVSKEDTNAVSEDKAETTEQPEKDTSTEESKEESEETEEKPVTFKNEAEFETEVEARAEKKAQSMKDKELAPLSQKVKDLSKENATLKRQLEDKHEDTALSKLMEAETETWGETPEVKEFHAARTELKAEFRKLLAEREKFNDERAEFEAVRSGMKIKLLSKDLNIPEEILSKELEGVKDEAHEKAVIRALIAERDRQAKEDKPAEKPKEKQERARPDGGGHSAYGGIDFSRIRFDPDAPSASDMIAAGLKKKK
jgi:hypothetical protein